MSKDVFGWVVFAGGVIQAVLGFLIAGWVHHHWSVDSTQWMVTVYFAISPFAGFAIYCLALRKCGFRLGVAAVLAGLVSFVALYLGMMGAAAVYGS